MAYEKQFANMNEAFARLCTTADAKEDVQAFFENADLSGKKNRDIDDRPVSRFAVIG